MSDGRHEGDGPPDGVGFDVEHMDQSDSGAADGLADAEQHVHESTPQRKHRRVKTEPVPGSDPTPQPESPRHSENENDERLKADKPPHWG